MKTSSRLTLLLCLLLLPSLSGALAQEAPLKVMYLSQAMATSDPLISQGLIDALDAFGFVDRNDYDPFLQEPVYGNGVEFATVGIVLDPAEASLQLAAYLEQGHDILITASTTATQLAANVTQNMEEPPIVVFVGVDDPYAAGFASSSCIKLPNVTGTRSVVPYDAVLAAVHKLDPDIATIGTLYHSADPAGVVGAAAIAEIGESLGLTVIVRAYTDVPSLSLAAEALLSTGAEAIVLPNEAGASQSLALVLHPLMTDNEIPLIAADASLVYSGATIGVGSLNLYHWGINIGRLLVAHLQGEIDIATAAISPASLALSMGIGLDSAAESNIQLPPALLDEADFHLIGFQSHLTEKGKKNTWQVESLRALGDFLVQFTTPETFEFVQAALDAAES